MTMLPLSSASQPLRDYAHDLARADGIRVLGWESTDYQAPAEGWHDPDALVAILHCADGTRRPVAAGVFHFYERDYKPRREPTIR